MTHRDGLPRLSDSVAHASRCPASPRRTLLAENLGKPTLWFFITAPWYMAQKALGDYPEWPVEAPGRSVYNAPS